MTKEEYKDIYIKAVERERDDIIAQIKEDLGDVDIDEWLRYEIWYAAECSLAEDMNAEEVVGYYIYYYGDDALKMWLTNILLLFSNLTPQDKEVTRLLKEVFSNED